MLQLARGEHKLSMYSPTVSMIQTHSNEYLDAVMKESALHQAYWRSQRRNLQSLMSMNAMLRRGADDSLEGLVNKFAEKNMGSGDACHARVLEAKHLLNDLHTRLQDLQRDIEAKEDVVEAEQAVLEGERTKKKAIEEWKKTEMEKCKEEREEAEKMYQRYNNELKELQQIAAPNVTMQLSKNRTEGTITVQSTTSLLQFQGMPKSSFSLLGFGSQLHDTLYDTLGAQQELVHCLSNSESNSSTSNSTYVPTATASPEVCAEEQEQLKRNFTKAYVAISKIKDSYDAARNDTICDTSVEDEFNSRTQPILEKIAQAADALEAALNALRNMESELNRLNEAEKRLEKHIRELSDLCENSEEVNKYLGNVRDLIIDMKKCPGMDRVKFQVATFQGFAVCSQNSATDTDQAQDLLMDLACRGAIRNAPGARAALHSEIMNGAIVGGPVNNTGAAELMGKCTGDDCVGDANPQAVSGHARICWKRGASLDAQGAEKTCTSGTRIAICVTEATPPKPEAEGSTSTAPNTTTAAPTT